MTHLFMFVITVRSENSHACTQHSEGTEAALVHQEMEVCMVM